MRFCFCSGLPDGNHVSGWILMNLLGIGDQTPFLEIMVASGEIRWQGESSPLCVPLESSLASLSMEIFLIKNR
jgi:hypothetical protein